MSRGSGAGPRGLGILVLGRAALSADGVEISAFLHERPWPLVGSARVQQRPLRAPGRAARRVPRADTARLRSGDQSRPSRRCTAACRGCLARLRHVVEPSRSCALRAAWPHGGPRAIAGCSSTANSLARGQEAATTAACPTEAADPATRGVLPRCGRRSGAHRRVPRTRSSGISPSRHCAGSRESASGAVRLHACRRGVHRHRGHDQRAYLQERGSARGAGTVGMSSPALARPMHVVRMRRGVRGHCS